MMRPHRSEEKSFADAEVAERAIMLQVLRDDHALKWTRAQLEREIYDILPEDLAAAIDRLREEGCVLTAGDLVWSSRCAWHLDDLGMVSI